MNLHPIDRHATDTAVTRSASPARRGRATRPAGMQRLGARLRGIFASMPRPATDTVSIEEAIARFVAANPGQLYRGGA